MSVIEVPVTEKYDVLLVDEVDGIIEVQKNGEFARRFKADEVKTTAEGVKATMDRVNLPQLVRDEVHRLAREYLASRPLSVDITRAHTVAYTCKGHIPVGEFTFSVSGPDATALQAIFKREGPHGVVRLRVDQEE